MTFIYFASCREAVLVVIVDNYRWKEANVRSKKSTSWNGASYEQNHGHISTTALFKTRYLQLNVIAVGIAETWQTKETPFLGNAWDCSQRVRCFIFTRSLTIPIAHITVETVPMKCPLTRDDQLWGTHLNSVCNSVCAQCSYTTFAWLLLFSRKFFLTKVPNCTLSPLTDTVKSFMEISESWICLCAGQNPSLAPFKFSISEVAKLQRWAGLVIDLYFPFTPLINPLENRSSSNSFRLSCMIVFQVDLHPYTSGLWVPILSKLIRFCHFIQTIFLRNAKCRWVASDIWPTICFSLAKLSLPYKATRIYLSMDGATSKILLTTPELQISHLKVHWLEIDNICNKEASTYLWAK